MPRGTATAGHGFRTGVAVLGWDTWRNTWLRLVHGIALNGRVTVLCGSLMPSQLETLPARKFVGPIRFCTLD